MTELFEIAALNAAYAAAIDANRLEEWPGFFHDRCLYKVTTADNHEKGYQAGLIYADSRAMLIDRIAALRQANIYERQRYRHILGMPLVTAGFGRDVVSCCPYHARRSDEPFCRWRLPRYGTTG
jgi:3-phenylpropionate/cinnamic acid dioxygenase small subunit